ncbi:MAG: ribosome maturation factor RimP [Acidobacteriota bacterium]|nr:ribosome maturation factor RimP [Acidobacteriota bacterium]
MSGSALSPSLVAELEAIAEGEGCELAHAEFKGGRLLVVLDHPEAVTIQHCERVSKQISSLLDVEDFGRGRYTLEVSSPGLDRQLYRPKDYQRFLGHLARVRFRNEDGERQTIIGRMERLDDGVLAVVETRGTDKKTGQPRTLEHQIPLSAIELARLEIEL